MRYARLVEWWTDDPTDPDRPLLSNLDVQRLITSISPGAQGVDLGGVMSLNVGLEAEGLVLRVHQPFVSRPRLLALQEVRRHLASRGLEVPMPVVWQGAPLIRCRNRWAELETFVPHTQPARTLGTYAWLFREAGRLDRALRTLPVHVPRPLVATYAPPGSLLRWLPVTEAAVAADPEAADAARLVRRLALELRRRWIPAGALPVQLIHGDVSPRNICPAADGATVYLDFGFLARRPRIHGLAYATAFMLYALGTYEAPDSFDWASIPGLIEEYESSAGVRLTPVERRALAPYAAAVPLYAAALDGFTENPAGKLCARLPFVSLSAWILDHPDALLGEASERR
jgi:Ser/Thr protein kinase RdoA (MazF antagonist)